MMKWKLLLLKMLIQAYPIIADEKPIPDPFAVVVNHRHEALALAEKISPKPVVITFDSSKAEVENAIAWPINGSRYKKYSRNSGKCQ